MAFLRRPGTARDFFPVRRGPLAVRNKSASDALAGGVIARSLGIGTSFWHGVVGGAVAGAASALAVRQLVKEDHLEEARRRLPRLIILLRHGESEGNADHTLYRTMADNLIELTEKGSSQAVEAGKRIKGIIGNDNVHIFTSPFQRTLQTARNARMAFEDQVVHTYVTTQIREQEFGNLQGEEFKHFRDEQLKVGRLYYRFPTGESGCDVFDRAKAWWDSLMLINERPGYDRADSILVVTHGLTMRLILMQLYGWSPDTFHTVWNAGNCEMYVLRKDLSKRGFSPYVLDGTVGDSPKSSSDVLVEFSTGEKKVLKLDDYLSLPQPRTVCVEMVKERLAEQHALDPGSIVGVDVFCGRHKKFM